MELSFDPELEVLVHFHIAGFDLSCAEARFATNTNSNTNTTSCMRFIICSSSIQGSPRATQAIANFAGHVKMNAVQLSPLVDRRHWFQLDPLLAARQPWQRNCKHQLDSNNP